MFVLGLSARGDGPRYVSVEVNRPRPEVGHHRHGAGLVLGFAIGDNRTIEVIRRTYTRFPHRYLFPSAFSPAQPSSLYRCRWEAELLFCEFKTRYRLDELPSTESSRVVKIVQFARILLMFPAPYNRCEPPCLVHLRGQVLFGADAATQHDHVMNVYGS